MSHDTVELVRKHVEEIMKILNIEKTPGNENTPLRIAKMWSNELFKNRNDENLYELMKQMTLFPAENDNRVTVKTKFSSVCEHHWLPFMGRAIITYIPDKNIIGLSKIPRAVEYFSKRPQVQERLTQDIGEFLFSVIQPKYLRVTVSAEHQCVLCRGVEKPCTTCTVFEFGRGESYNG